MESTCSCSYSDSCICVYTERCGLSLTCWHFDRSPVWQLSWAPVRSCPWRGPCRCRVPYPRDSMASCHHAYLHDSRRDNVKAARHRRRSCPSFYELSGGTDDDDNAIAARRSRAVNAHWLILAERRSPAIFKSQLAGRCICSASLCRRSSSFIYTSISFGRYNRNFSLAFFFSTFLFSSFHCLYYFLKIALFKRKSIRYYIYRNEKRKISRENIKISKETLSCNLSLF